MNCVVCSAEVRDDARFCPACGAEQPKTDVEDSDDPFIGQTVARNFKIEKLLGVGGMGKVYKARQLSLDKSVVIKILHDHFRDDPQLVQRFQREARAASRLNHPNSIQVIDFGKDENGVLYMAIEFLEGEDLFAILQKDGPFSQERISRVMKQVCSALADAHAQHVIHRDLKPENIMVEDRRGQKDYVKVLDFGIAKIQDPDDTGQALTQAGMVCGTPEYMSPEQARGMELDARSDLYALGVLTYQLATGELPFTADSPIGIVTKHILEEPPAPRTKYPQLNISEPMEALILKSMAKGADDRFQSAIEMGEAFEALLRGVYQEQSGAAPVAPTNTAPTNTGPIAQPPPTGPTTETPATTDPTAAATPGPTTSTGAPTNTGAVTNPDQGAIDTGGGGGAMKFVAMGVVLLLLVGGGIGVFASGILDGDKPKEDAGPIAKGEGEGEGEVKTGEGEGEAPTEDPKIAALRKEAKRLHDEGVANKDRDIMKAAIEAQTRLTNDAPTDVQAKMDLKKWEGELAAMKPSVSPPNNDGDSKYCGYIAAAEKKKSYTRALSHAKKCKSQTPGFAGIDDKIAELEAKVKEAATTKVDPPKGGGCEEAKKVYAEAQPIIFSGNNAQREAMAAKLKAAWQSCPSFTKPLRSIAVIHQKNGKKVQACNAIKMYVKQSGLDKKDPAMATRIAKPVCQ